MSQLSPQDIQALQQLISVFAPKVIERLKECESACRDLGGRVEALEEQVKLLHTAAPKTERAKKGSKKNAPEVPQLLPQEGEAAPEQLPLTGAAAGAPSAETSALGNPVAGTVAVTPIAETEASPASSLPLQEERHGAGTLNDPANGGIAAPLEFPIVDGIPVTGQMIYGVQYIMAQGFTDPKVIAEPLDLPVNIVIAIMNMPIAEQTALMELAQRQAGA